MESDYARTVSQLPGSTIGRPSMGPGMGLSAIDDIDKFFPGFFFVGPKANPDIVFTRDFFHTTALRAVAGVHFDSHHRGFGNHALVRGNDRGQGVPEVILTGSDKSDVLR